MKHLHGKQIKKMSNIGLSSLFHFTGSFENLIGILKNEFKPHYCPERIFYHKRIFTSYALPMVCFCDIPLSQIKTHIENYGHYGIGMSKEWAEKKGLNPILYLKRNSKLSEKLISMRPDISDLLKSSGERETYHSFLYLFRYLKNYEGSFLKGGMLTRTVNFYNEREWRHVPNTSVLGMDKYNDQEIRKEYNSKLEALGFEPNDIKYIIVDNESEIGVMIKTIREIKSKYPPAVVDILTSRIITSEQIWNDF
jgi:hypothetical protein